jgi:predicted enzyme related to lactoylglutathione lyase
MVLGSMVASALVAAAAYAARDDGARDSKPAAALGYHGGMVCYVHVSDLTKSVQWYEGILGLKVLSQVDEIGWCELQSPAADLAIGLAQVAKGAKVDAQGGATIVFGVKDVDAARRTLETGGVKFEGATTVHEGYVKLAAFFDPDGNLLTLSQSLVSQESRRN